MYKPLCGYVQPLCGQVYKQKELDTCMQPGTHTGEPGSGRRKPILHFPPYTQVYKTTCTQEGTTQVLTQVHGQ